MRLTNLVLVIVTFAIFTGDLASQETTEAPGKQKPTPLDDRGGLPVPKSLSDIKSLSMTYWIKFRGTNQQVYRFVNEAAEFRAYEQICKRHTLNIEMAPITKLANRYIQAAIPAHYDEPEFELLDPLSKTEQQEFLEDMSGDVYGFEFGYRVAELNAKIDESGMTRKTYCASIKETYKDSYIALKATAQRRLGEFSYSDELLKKQ